MPELFAFSRRSLTTKIRRLGLYGIGKMLIMMIIMVMMLVRVLIVVMRSW